MKKNSTRLIIFISIFCLFTSSGCKKVWDYVKDHPGGIANNCRIEQITYQFEADYYGPMKTYYDTVTIAYNTSGNPIRMKYAVSKLPEFYTFPSVPGRLFRYDDKNRLLVYIDGLVNTGEGATPFPTESGYVSSVIWHKFTYVSSTLVTDSAWLNGVGNYLTQDIPEQSSGYPPHFLYEYTLDAYGRIIKAVQKAGLEILSIKNFTYDAAGNLVKPGFTYTNKKNILQTNNVWMFLANDYSVNTREGQALSYNNNNLPVLFNKELPPYFTASDYFDYPPGDAKAQANYKCR